MNMQLPVHVHVLAIVYMHCTSQNCVCFVYYTNVCIYQTLLLVIICHQHVHVGSINTVEVICTYISHNCIVY